jgi:predicted DsbA family dithiol-disulfide isomerase
VEAAMTATLTPAREALSRGIVTIDVISDVVCPWCYVGKRRLEAAISQSGQTVEVHWRPFQLDPTIPAGGLDREAYLTGKFGSMKKVAAIHDQLTTIGAEVDIPFAFERITRSPNTLDAHRIIRWSASSNVQGAVVEALFRAYFVEGRDIGNRGVLAEIAAASGMDAAIVARLFAAGSDERDVREEIATAVRLGVSGVPFFILAGRYAVPGAQSPDVLAAAITKASEAEPV